MKDLRKTTAADIMSTPVLEGMPTERVTDAARRMIEHGVHCLIVPHRDSHRLPGVMTLRDVIDALASEAQPLDALRVEDAMTRPCLNVQASTCLLDCINQMRQFGVRTVPVMDGGRSVGVLSFTDVVRFAVGDETA